MRRIQIIASRCLLLLAVGVVGLLVHEMGHGLCAEALGGTFESLSVAPGVTLYPEIGWTDWNGEVGRVCYCEAEGWQNKQRGLVALAGSTTTWVLSVLALVALFIFRPRGTRHWALVAFALLLLDIMAYTCFPMIGTQVELWNPNEKFPVTCDKPTPLYGPDGISTGLRLSLQDIACTKVHLRRTDVTSNTCKDVFATAPVVYLALEGTSSVERHSPVFLKIATADRVFWGVAPGSERHNDVIDFFYLLDGGDGEYTVKSAYVIVNGWRHWIVVGGDYPEPVYGAALMGLSPELFIGAVISVSIVQIGLLAIYLVTYCRRERARRAAIPVMGFVVTTLVV